MERPKKQVTTICKKVDTINKHIDKVFESALNQLKVSVNVNDADWQKIQELFAKERQWMTAQIQGHIREVNSMFADESWQYDTRCLTMPMILSMKRKPDLPK